MQQKGLIVAAATALVALAVACGSKAPQPSPISATSPMGGDAAADGSTLKVTAPTLVSPINNEKLTGTKPNFVWTAAVGKYAASSFGYRAQLLSATGALLKETTTTSLQWAMVDDVEVTTAYTWRVRAEIGTYVGPWSSVGTFRSMDKPTAFLRNNELYDPLVDGTTLGKIEGPAHFVPGVGLSLDAEETFVEYTLPQSLRDGEFSALITNLSVISDTEDPKLRLFTMREGWSAINDNIYRMSVDKRGNGAVAWRFISGDNGAGEYIETIGSERVVVPMHENLTYFYQASWRGGAFNVLIKEGGFYGNTVYSYGKPYKGTYQPSPHNVYLGSPFRPGDRGEPSTCDGMIIRQVWVSSSPRPSYINQ